MTDTAPARPPIPSVVIGELLGSGAFGAVYRGRHQTLDVDVAVKLVRGNPTALELALSEARLMARLDHPNLVRIHDAGRVDASIYLVLELMDGGSLANAHALPAGRLLAITSQLLAGLQSLHDARIIHRDIKPANCLVRQRDQRVKLGDLGVAAEQTTRAELEMAGTLPFMAPEIFDHPPRVGEASDLYALGMTLACLALPADPFPHGSVTELISWARQGPRIAIAEARPDLPGRLVSLIQRLLAARPEDRPATATAALASVLAEGSIEPVRSFEVTSDRRVGPWVLGEQVYDSVNWRSWSVTHVSTGAPGRLSRVNPNAPVARAGGLIGEAAARAARFDHPGLLAMLDWGVIENSPYVVSAPQGRSLMQLVESSGPRDEVEAIDLVADLADAVAYLHARGLVYQVVEPGAAFVTPDARHAELGWAVYCVPAGSPLEREDGTAQRAGIPVFMAPEAFNATGTIDPAVDLYGLGQVLYYLCAGAPAHTGTSLYQLAGAKLAQPPPLGERAPMVTQPTVRLVAELLSADPAKRPASAVAVRDELRRIASRLRGR